MSSKSLIFSLFVIPLFFCIASFSCVSAYKPTKLATPYPTSQLIKTVYVDSSFSNDQVNDIIDAIDSWECSTNDLIQFKILLGFDKSSMSNAYGQDSDNILVILNTKASDPRIKDTDEWIKKRPGDSERYTVGLYTSDHDIPIILLVSDRLDKNDFKSCAEHELGHAIMLDHIDEKDAIMYKNLDEGSKKITSTDLASFCAIYWCDDTKLKACNK